MAGWAKQLWLQWVASVFILIVEALFLATYQGRP
jgi:hypothetical protein